MSEAHCSPPTYGNIKITPKLTTLLEMGPEDHAQWSFLGKGRAAWEPGGWWRGGGVSEPSWQLVWQPGARLYIGWSWSQRLQNVFFYSSKYSFYGKWWTNFELRVGAGNRMDFQSPETKIDRLTNTTLVRYTLAADSDTLKHHSSWQKAINESPPYT